MIIAVCNTATWPGGLYCSLLVTCLCVTKRKHRFKQAKASWQWNLDSFITSLAGPLTQGKLQRGLLFCLELCHVVIQAVLINYCNTKLLSIAILDNRCLDHNMTQFNTKEQTMLLLALCSQAHLFPRTDVPLWIHWKPYLKHFALVTLTFNQWPCPTNVT